MVDVDGVVAKLDGGVSTPPRDCVVKFDEINRRSTFSAENSAVDIIVMAIWAYDHRSNSNSSN